MYSFKRDLAVVAIVGGILFTVMTYFTSTASSGRVISDPVDLDYTSYMDNPYVKDRDGISLRDLVALQIYARRVSWQEPYSGTADEAYKAADAFLCVRVGKKVGK